MRPKSRGVLLRLDAHRKFQDNYVSSLIEAVGRRRFFIALGTIMRAEARCRHEAGMDYFDELLAEAEARARRAVGE